MGHLPDLFALCVLLIILYFLRGRHTGEDVHLWFIGLLLLLGESIAHLLFNSPLPSLLHRIDHSAALDCYAAAGAVFLYAAIYRTVPRRRLALALIASASVRIGVLTLYGMDVRAPRPFYLLALAGSLISVASTLWLRFRRPWLVLFLHASLWTVFCVAIAQAEYRFAAYWLLCCLFAQAAIYFYRTMPARSIGRYTVVSGFAVWALLFLVHPIVSPQSRFFDLVDGMWSLQKFQIAVGMLIVLLETQVEQVKELALHDPLTGLPNRRLLDDRLNQAALQAARTRTRVGFFMLDLDEFKSINDRFGHGAGDHVLCEVSRHLSRVLRSSDTIARLGGDEFAIVVSGFTTEQPLAGQVLRAVSTPISYGGATFSMTASVGLAIYPDDTTELSQLQQMADDRMYRDKRTLQAHARVPLSPAVSSLGMMVNTENSSL